MKIQFGKCAWTVPSQATASIGRFLPAIDDLRLAIDAALSAPMDFSCLDQAIVPGDRIAVAVDPSLPSLPGVVSGVVQWLVEHGAEPSNISVVIALECGQAESLREQLDRLGLTEVSIERHDPDDTQRLSYLAANESAQAIYVNRTLVDADVVIPISCTHSNHAIDYLGAFSIFPWFSSRETMGQMRNYLRLSDGVDRESSQFEARQAAWWLGLIVAIQVIPASEDRVSGILCGTLEALEVEAQNLISRGQVDPRDNDPEADLVIAVLDGADQGWTQVARALHNALRNCATGGSIVLCTNVCQPIGPGLRRLRETNRDPSQIARKLSRECSEDALAASVILDATREHHVYLVSEHKSQTIEELGLSVLSEASELANLVKHHSRSLVIYSAQHP